MTKRLLALGCAVILPFVFSGPGQTASPGRATVARTAGRPAAAQPPSTPAPSSPQRALLDRYCVGCHSQHAKAAGQDARAKVAIELNDMIVNSSSIIPLVHRGRVSAKSNALDGVVFGAWDSELWQIADWSRAK